MRITEVHQTDHYKERKQERTIIQSIGLPQQAYGPYNKEDVDLRLKQEITDRLLRILRAFESSTSKEMGSIVRNYPILSPYLLSGEKKYPILIVTQTQDKGEGIGHTYELIKIGDKLITLLVREKGRDPFEETKKHIERQVQQGKQPEKVLTYPIDVLKTKNSDFEIDLETLMRGKKVELETSEISQESLPYKIRTDYRKDATFTHNQYGQGTIVNTSVGGKGDPGIKGKLDWVDVDFKTPFVKGGKMTTIRRIEPVYAVTYFKNKK